MKIVEVAALSPGQCRGCGGSSDREYFLDMEYIEYFHGTVYYCNFCVDQIAKTAGYVQADQRHIAKLQLELDTLREQNNEFGTLFDALLGNGIDLYGLLDFLNCNPFSESTERRERAARRRAVKLAAGEKGIAQSSDEQRPIDVPVVTGNDKSLLIQL